MQSHCFIFSEDAALESSIASPLLAAYARLQPVVRT